jgi:SHQ1 protein.
MPITPRFKLSQTETQITIIIHIPHIRVSASTLEIVVDGCDFHFHSSPYLLYLSFPGELVDDVETCREAKTIYDPSNQNGVLTISIYKKEEGIWKDLDLLGNLVGKSTFAASNDDIRKQENKIQVISSTDDATCLQEESNSEQQDATFFPDDIHSCLKPHYGFLNMHHSVFTAYAREGLSHDMLEIPNPDEMPVDERREQRLNTERIKFDPDRYLGDFDLSCDSDDEAADMIFIEAMKMEPHWNRLSSVHDLTNAFEKLDTEETEKVMGTQEGSHDFFNEEEKMQLVENKAVIPPLSQISKEQKESLLLSLLDIMYAYAYDHRTTIGDATCESSWTLMMLSPTLSWLEIYTPPYDDILSILRWSIRRALIYPYLRNFDFVANVLVKDLQHIFAGGKRVILRCLLQIQKILDKSEFHYLFNKLYICPYIIWIQRMDDEDLLDFSCRLNKCVSTEMAISKASLDLNLEIHEERLLSETKVDEDNSERSSEDDDSNDSVDQCSDSSHSDCETECRVSNILLDSEIDNGIQLETSQRSATGGENANNGTISTTHGPKKILIEELP